MNRVRDHAKPEREFVTSQLSLRELCRKHGISTHSSVVVQAKKGRWAEKREQYQAQESDAYVARHAVRHADRQAEISDRALDAIDEAITRFCEDLKATKAVRQPDGSITDDRPSHISEGRDLNVRSDLPVDALSEFIEATPGG